MGEGTKKMNKKNILNTSPISYVFTINKLDTPFEYIKFISIIVATLLLSFTRVSNIKNLNKFLPSFLSKNVWSWLLWLILVINIGEAVMTEFKNKHYINPLIGIWYFEYCFLYCNFLQMIMNF